MIYGSTVFNLSKNCHTFPIMNVISSHSQQQGFLFSTSIPAIVKSHPNRYEMIVIVIPLQLFYFHVLLGLVIFS